MAHSKIIVWRPRAAERRPVMAVHLRVRIRGVRPEVWRTLVVPERAPLAMLHRVLQVAFDWTNSHLHYFTFGKLRFTDPAFVEEDTGDPYAEDSLGDSYRGVSLDQFALQVGDRFQYTYDLGENWEHDIEVEAIEETASKAKPRCIDGDCDAPPEDYGGELIEFDIARVNTRLARLR